MDFPISVSNIGLVDGKFVDEDITAGTPGSLIPAVWGNSITLEMLNVIEAAGLEPSEADLTQLLQAIRKVGQAGAGNKGTDTGAANVYTVAYTPAITALTDGAVLRFKAKTANTGASTFSPNGMLAKPLVGLGLAALQGGEIIANGMCTVVYSTALDQWVLLSSAGGSLQVASASKSMHAMQLGQAVGRVLNIRVLTATTVYAKTPGAKAGYGKLVSGGGAGGGVPSTATGNTAAGLGGSAGGISEFYLPIEVLDGQTITIGAGGTGVPNSAGNNGGTSSIGGVISVPGGQGGSAGSNAPPPWTLGESGNSAAPTGGNIANSPGPSGGSSSSNSTGSILSGRGGSCPGFGAGGNARGNIRGNGTSGTGYGAGGSGAIEQSAGAGGFAGGAGTPGVCIIWELA